MCNVPLPAVILEELPSDCTDCGIKRVAVCISGCGVCLGCEQAMFSFISSVLRVLVRACCSGIGIAFRHVL